MSTVTPLPTPDDIGSVVASELRMLLARYGKPQGDAARIIGVNQGQFSKRMRGVIAFNVNELEMLAAYFNTTVAALVGGETRNPRPDGPDGGLSAECTRRDSNSQPSDPKVLPLRRVA